MFLWHFPSSCPDRTLSCTLPYEARTFLTPDRLSSMKARSSSVLRTVTIPPLDNLGRIDQPRPGPAQVGVSIKRQHSTGLLRSKRSPRLDRAKLSDGDVRFGKVETARRDDDRLRIGLRDRAPLQPPRVGARMGQDWVTSGEIDELGNPVAGAHRRIGPLENERSRPL